VLDENYFEKIESKQLWFLGLMASDGFIINDKSFGISQSGYFGNKIIKHIKEELKYGGPIYSGNTIGEDYYALTITSDKLVSEFSKFNIKNKKSLVYELPSFKSEIEVRDFVRGYIDGDGSVGVYDNGNGYEYLVISFVGTKNFINELGKILPIKFSSIREIITANNCFEIRWYGKKAIEFCEWVYSNNNLFYGKKIDIFKKYLVSHSPNYLKYDIKKIEVKNLVELGYKVSEIVKITGIPFQTIYKWKKEY
jgi:hypothetical protein